MPLMIGGAVVLLLLVLLGYLLFSARGRYTEGSSQLTMVQGRLQRLSSRPVFPSEANVQTMGKQLAIYQEYLDGLYQAMKEGQTEAQPVNRDGFRYMLEEGLRRMAGEARDKQVKIAPNLAFGVQRYIEGASPSDEELPRLVDQFRSIAALCSILFAASIDELTGVERTVFEQSAQMAAPVQEEFTRRGRGRNEPQVVASPTDLYQDPDGLFSREHYVFTFRAQDSAIWKVLDRLSKGAPFVVVTKVEITNPARPSVVLPKTAEEAAPAPVPAPVSSDGWQAPGSATAPAGQRTEPTILPRELRVVAGRELADVRLEVDLYRFVEVAAGEGEENP